MEFCWLWHITFFKDFGACMWQLVISKDLWVCRSWNWFSRVYDEVLHCLTHAIFERYCQKILTMMQVFVTSSDWIILHDHCWFWAILRRSHRALIEILMIWRTISFMIYHLIFIDRLALELWTFTLLTFLISFRCQWVMTLENVPNLRWLVFFLTILWSSNLIIF